MSCETTTTEQWGIAPADLAMCIGRQVSTPDGVGTLTQVGDEGFGMVTFPYPATKTCEVYDIALIKPLRRPLSTITPEEAAKAAEVFLSNHRRTKNRQLAAAAGVRYLFRQDLDLYNWLNDGLAVRKEDAL